MSKSEERFNRNTEGLQRLGVDTTWTDDDTRVQVEGADLELAVKIARALTDKLENGELAEINGDRFDFLYDMSLKEAADRANKGRSPLFETQPDSGRFSIRVEKTQSEETILVASVRNDDREKDELYAPNLLKNGFLSVLRCVELVPVKDALQETLEETLEQIDVEVRGSSKTAKEIRSDRERDLETAPETFRLLGVKEADNLRQLNELWEDRSLDRVAIVDLFLHLVEEKQKRVAPGKNGYIPEIRLIDLVQTGRHLPAADLRGEQQRKSSSFFVELGYDPKEIDRKVINADINRAQAFRYAAWLLNQSFMDKFTEGIKEELIEKGNIPSIRLFVKLSEEVLRIYKSYKDNDENEDLSIDWRKMEYDRELEFYKTCSLLCLNIFFGKDISELVKDR